MASDDGRLTEVVSRREFIVATGAAGAAGLAGCSGSPDGSDGNGGSDSDGDGGSDGSGSDGGDGSGSDGEDMALSGNIRISGSSTVFPVATAVGELFKEQHPEVTFDISKDGSSGGFENVFIPGDSDINNASRAIKDEEVELLRDRGIEPVEFQIAKDALTVIVNNDNDFIDTLTYDELEQIWTPDNPPEQWSDVNSDWPDEPIDLYGPASTSGTFDYFTETILGEAGRIRDDFEGTEEDDQIASGVEGNEYALGYLPFAYYTNNPEETTAVPLAVEAGDEPVAPSLDAASTGEYPLARPLFFYGNMNKIQEKRHRQELIRFYINKATDKQLIANQIGYVQSSDQRAQQNLDALDRAIAGEYEFSRDEDSSTLSVADIPTEGLAGNLRISGSSTVFPVATAVGELFKERNPDVTFDISKDGSSGGFENVFIPGDSDINNASRAIKDEEVEILRDRGIEPVEFQIAKDALTVVVNNENDFIDTLTYSELEQIWKPENRAETWSDVNPDWPDEPIDLYGPASTSGTFDYFTETILGEAGRIRDDFEGTEEDDQIASGVEGNEFALGYLPFAYYTNNPDDTTAVPLAIEAGDEPVAPSLDAASTGEYPLARPLFFYGNMNKIQQKRHLQGFIKYYVNKATDKQLIANRIGYVQSSDQRAQQNLQNLVEAIAGEYRFSR